MFVLSYYYKCLNELFKLNLKTSEFDHFQTKNKTPRSKYIIIFIKLCKINN